MVSQLKLIRPMLDAFGITYISDPTCEADDIIATYTKYAVQTIMMSQSFQVIKI